MIMKQNVTSLAAGSNREKANKRSKSAIILDILSVCTKGASKTRVVKSSELELQDDNSLY